MFGAAHRADSASAEVPGAELAAALFALHRLHVESVAWITSSRTRYQVSCISARRSCISHSMNAGAVAVRAGARVIRARAAEQPLRLFCRALLIVFMLQRGTNRLAARRHAARAFFVLGLASGLTTAGSSARSLALAAGVSVYVVDRRDRGPRYLFVPLSLVWPSNLIFIYPRWNVSQTVWWQYLFPLVVDAARGRRVAVRCAACAIGGAAFFVVTLAPALSIRHVYPFRFFNSRRSLSVPRQHGVFALAAAGLADAGGSLRRPTSVRDPRAAHVALPLAFLTWKQAHLYANADTLYTTTIDATLSAVAYHNLGALYLHGFRKISIRRFR